jgi:uncharacterized protein YjbI with pentapeptide repeats
MHSNTSEKKVKRPVALGSVSPSSSSSSTSSIDLLSPSAPIASTDAKVNLDILPEPALVLASKSKKSEKTKEKGSTPTREGLSRSSTSSSHSNLSLPISIPPTDISSSKKFPHTKDKEQKEKKAVVEKSLKNPFELISAKKIDLSALRTALNNKTFNINSKNANGMTLVHIAAKLRLEKIIKLLLEFNPRLDIKDNSDRTALHWAATYNAKEITKSLLRQGAIVSDSIYNEAAPDIQTLLNYRPGKKQRSIREICARGRQTSSQMTLLLLDQEDTTDDSSSDEETLEQLEEKLLEPRNTIPAIDDQEAIRQHQERVVVFNSARAAGKPTAAEFPDLKYVIHRGIHFDPQYFTKTHRRALYRTYLDNPAYTEPTFSYATRKFKEAEEKTTGVPIRTEKEIKQSTAHQTTTQYLENLKKTKNKKPKKPYKIKTEYYRLIQDYVHNYADVVNEGRLESDFGFSTKNNPLISASYLSERAYTYASGMLFGKGHRLNPHYRRSTQKPKHPCMGIVYSYAIDPEYAFTNSANVLDLNHQEMIGISGRFQHECEVIFESYIPERYMVMGTLLKLPDLSAKESTPERLKYKDRAHQGKFTRDQKSIKDLNTPIDSDKNIYAKKSKINKIVRHVISKEHELTDRKLTHKLYEEKLYPCYPFADQTFSHTPVKPPGSGGKWGEQKNPTNTQELKRTGPPPKAKKKLFPDASNDANAPSSTLPPAILPTSTAEMLKAISSTSATSVVGVESKGEIKAPAKIEEKRGTESSLFQRKFPTAAEKLWYDEDKIRFLLAQIVGPRPGITILDPIDILQEGGEVLKHNLDARLKLEAQAFSNGISLDTLDTQFLLPINLGRLHWAALYIRFEVGNRTKPLIGYFDPHGEKFASIPIKKILLEKLSPVYSDLVEQDILISPIQLQKDNYNCGPWILAIFDSLIKTGSLPPEDLHIQTRREAYDRMYHHAVLTERAAPISSPSSDSSSSSSSLVLGSMSPINISTPKKAAGVICGEGKGEINAQMEAEDSSPIIEPTEAKTAWDYGKMKSALNSPTDNVGGYPLGTQDWFKQAYKNGEGNFAGIEFVSGMDFSDLELEGVDFSNATLKGAVFTKAVLIDVNFSNAHLEGAQFSTNENSGYAQFFSGQTSFKHAYLNGALFEGCHLHGVSFDSADLTECEFTQCEFDCGPDGGEGASFREAIVTNAIFKNVRCQPDNPKDEDDSDSDDDRAANFDGVIGYIKTWIGSEPQPKNLKIAKLSSVPATKVKISANHVAMQLAGSGMGIGIAPAKQVTSSSSTRLAGVTPLLSPSPPAKK